ncbi:hypothetical protein K466DRAFT_592593 [Polyporus arcularius HHB13444]|uniref:Uncharacterized protein n=1 Tax=Polyporus arcularius HHB13444 TaxID=1314778 RepID=A0A5C3NRP6_9APHY|nr:hypothetical protein K466DRAFT_592593 [Polyporus arcularius HHB13444]
MTSNEPVRPATRYQRTRRSLAVSVGGGWDAAPPRVGFAWYVTSGPHYDSCVSLGF